MPKNVAYRKILIIGALAAVLGLMMPKAAAASAAASPKAGACQEMQLPVALTQGAPKHWIIAGTLCRPTVWAPGTRNIDVLVSGSTYNRAYWDWPQQSQLYSYTQKTLQSGRAVFYYDRLGTGRSSHPLSALTTPMADAFSLHQIISFVRSDGYARVNLIGHSFGSAVIALETASYNDADRVVLTSQLHSAGKNMPLANASLYPALLDPVFIGTLDPGYITTLPGKRGQLFYSPGADPSVMAYDEAHKDVVSSVGFLTAAATFYMVPPLAITKNIKLPTLLVAGEEDGLLCGLTLNCHDLEAVTAYEQPYYANAASFDVKLVPQTGHDLALHPSAGESFAMINAWIKQ